MTQGEYFRTVFHSSKLEGPMVVEGWQSPRINWHTAVPMLVVNDGGDYVTRTGLIGLLESLVRSGDIPPLRLAALHPVDRGTDYRASDNYADVVAHELRQWLAFAPTSKYVALGTSFGAVAWLHAHRRHSWVFDGLILQSGSYFKSDEDYPDHYDPDYTIRPFVDGVHGAKGFERLVPIQVTCSVDEGNFGLNELMVDSLRRQKYQVAFHKTNGGHDWPFWQAALAPALIGSLQ
ncbi:MAG: putative esterase [Candidatus Saccharibacteria bacterium]|jgi:enterochelin esterase family protein|nr:putative esterase [Candidatus Saccharibacteria bacterium]